MAGLSEINFKGTVWVVVGHFRFVKRHLHDEPNEVVHAALKKMGLSGFPKQFSAWESTG